MVAVDAGNKREPKGLKTMSTTGWGLLGAVLLAVACGSWRTSPAADGAVRFSSAPTETPVTGAAVSVIDDRQIWVGLAYTEDGGATWVARHPPATSALEFDESGPDYGAHTHFITAEKGWLGGLRSIWRTDDGGLSWRAQLPGSRYWMAFAGSSGWLAAGDGNAVENYRTEDVGETWKKCGEPWVLSRAAPWSWASFLDPNDGWITIGSYNDRQLPFRGGVARTMDGGCTWEALWHDDDPSENLGSIQFVAGGFGWLFSFHGRLLETGDGGSHWTPVALPPSWFIEDAYLVSRSSSPW